MLLGLCAVLPGLGLVPLPASSEAAIKQMLRIQKQKAKAVKPLKPEPGAGAGGGGAVGAGRAGQGGDGDSGHGLEGRSGPGNGWPGPSGGGPRGGGDGDRGVASSLTAVMQHMHVQGGLGGPSQAQTVMSHASVGRASAALQGEGWVVDGGGGQGEVASRGDQGWGAGGGQQSGRDRPPHMPSSSAQHGPAGSAAGGGMSHAGQQQQQPPPKPLSAKFRPFVPSMKVDKLTPANLVHELYPPSEDRSPEERMLVAVLLAAGMGSKQGYGRNEVGLTVAGWRERERGWWRRQA